MNKIISIVVFFVFTTVVTAQENTWTLQESIEYALKHNISIKQSALDLKLAEITKNEAIGNYLPSINGRASLSWNTGLTQNITTGVLENQTTRNFSTGVSANLTLFQGLRNLRLLQKAKMARMASQYSLGKMKDDIALFVANAYLQILVNKETLNVLEGQHQVTLKQLERTQELVDAGVLPSGDLLQIKATGADELQQIIGAKNALKIARINLAQTLLIEDYENFRIADKDYQVPLNTITNKPVEEIIDAAEKSRYEVKIAQKNVDLAKKQVQVARSAYYPSLSAFFNYNTRASGGSSFGPTKPFLDQLYLYDGISYGLSLNVPIFNGFSTRNTVKRSKINVDRREFQLKQAKLDLESNVYQAYVDAKGAAKAYEAAKLALNAQQLAYDYTVEKYDVGLANSFELSEAKFRLTNAKSQLIQAKYDYIFKLKVLELYFGIPVSQIKL